MCSIFSRADGSASESQFPSQLTAPHYDPRTFQSTAPHTPPTETTLARHRARPSLLGSLNAKKKEKKRRRRRRRKKKREVEQGRRKRESPKKGVLSEIKSSSTGVTRGLLGRRASIPVGMLPRGLEKPPPPPPSHLLLNPSLFLSLSPAPPAPRPRAVLLLFCPCPVLSLPLLHPARRTKILYRLSLKVNGRNRGSYTCVQDPGEGDASAGCAGQRKRRDRAAGWRQAGGQEG